jgi:hypothetical protein
MKTDQKFPSFKALNGHEPVAGVDFDPNVPMSQDDKDFLAGVGIYTDTPEDADKSTHKIKPLPLYVSVEADRCVVCRRSCAKHGRHAVELPVSLRGGLVCDDCAHDYCIQCECCEAGHTIDGMIASGSFRSES